MLSFGYKIQNNSLFLSHKTGQPISDNSVMCAVRRVLKASGLTFMEIIKLN